MPDHVGHPTLAETALQNIIEDPRITIKRGIRQCALCLADGDASSQDQIIISNQLVLMALALDDMTAYGAQGRADIGVAK